LPRPHFQRLLAQDIAKAAPVEPQAAPSKNAAPGNPAEVTALLAFTPCSTTVREDFNIDIMEALQKSDDLKVVLTPFTARPALTGP
jgi:hypothetical protein